MFLKRVELIERHQLGSHSVLKKILRDALVRLKLTYRKIQLKRLELLKVLKYEPFVENYKFELNDLFEV